MIRPALLILLLAPALALAAPSISKVNGSVHAHAGSQYAELSTVNGSIRIDAGAEVDSADTVNGSIGIGEQALVGTAETVNGRIELERGARIERGAETVNGSIRLARESEVGGTVESVNGSISLDHARIGGDIRTVAGSITVGENSTVQGGILVEKAHGGWFSNWGKQNVPRVEIGANAVVEGELRFERKVELIVHPSARIGAVVGAAADEVEVERR